MAYRLESIAIGACRQLGRSQSLRSGGLRSYASASATSMTGQTSSSRIRPSVSVVALPSNTEIFGHQRRQFHLTPITQDEKSSGDAAVAAPAVDKTDEPIAAFTSPKVEALFQKFLHLDMIEIHLLGELINEKLGITISDAEKERMARGGGGGGNGGGDAAPAEVVEEKTIFDLKLTGFDAKSKIKVIKEVRAMTSLGLKEAKELVEGFPSTVKKDIKKEEAEELKAKLEGLGGQVEIV